VPCVGFGSSALLTEAKVSWLDGIALALIIAAVALALVRRNPTRWPDETKQFD
jgi:drug/metabolite transporter (DMT)-like permease